MIPFAPLFPDEAAEAMAVFHDLRIVDVAGSPTIGESCLPWVSDFAAAVFGAYDHSIGRRMIQEFMLLVSKKNTKSTIAAGIMLTALIRNWRLSAKFVIIAPTIEIANNSFQPARDMVKADPELDALLHVQEHYRTITHRGTGATLKVVAADSEAVGGIKATGILVDELWLFGKRANAQNMLREAVGGLASRPEGFVIYLTTQADDPPAGVMKDKLDYARAVRDGRTPDGKVMIDRKFLPVLYEFPPGMIERGEHRDKANFYVTNPNLGLSVDVEYIEREFDKAQVSGEHAVRGFLAKHLNVEIGLALASTRWAGADYWESQAADDLTLTDLLERSEVLVIGVDGGGLDDLLSIAVVGRERGTLDWLHWQHSWAHESVLERRKAEAPRLRDFDRIGELTIVSEPGADIEQLADIAAQAKASGKLAMVGLDPMGVGAIVDALAERGIPRDAIHGVSQGWTLTGAIKTAERKLADRTLIHGGAKIMAWAVGNAKVEPRGNAVVITKQAAGSAKIDPLMALFAAVVLMTKSPQAAPRSWWEAAA